MKCSQYTAREIARILGGTVEGNPDLKISSFTGIEHVKAGEMSFYANPKYEHYLYQCHGSLLIVNNDFQPKEPVDCTFVRVENSYSALMVLLKHEKSLKQKYSRHRSLKSHVALSAKLGKKVYVGDFAYIGKHCQIGDFTHVGENVYIGEGTKIGQKCILYPGVRIYPGMEIGDNVILHANCVIGSDGFGNAPQPDGSWEKIEHLGKVIIEDNVEIGANTTVDRAEMEATIIHRGVKIDNLCQIAHNVEIGENTAMAAMTGIAGSAKIGKSCIFAGQVGVVGHITIADHTTVGAQGGVIGNVRQPGQVLVGMPAIDRMVYMRAFAKFKASGKD